jgi:hypothetical protein
MQFCNYKSFCQIMQFIIVFFLFVSNYLNLFAIKTSIITKKGDKRSFISFFFCTVTLYHFLDIPNECPDTDFFINTIQLFYFFE